MGAATLPSASLRRRPGRLTVATTTAPPPRARRYNGQKRVHRCHADVTCSSRGSSLTLTPRGTNAVWVRTAGGEWAAYGVGEDCPQLNSGDRIALDRRAPLGDSVWHLLLLLADQRRNLFLHRLTKEGEERTTFIVRRLLPSERSPDSSATERDEPNRPDTSWTIQPTHCQRVGRSSMRQTSHRAGSGGRIRNPAAAAPAGRGEATISEWTVGIGLGATPW